MAKVVAHDAIQIPGRCLDFVRHASPSGACHSTMEFSAIPYFYKSAASVPLRREL